MASEETLAAFLAEPRNVIVVGARKDGRPHATPNWFHWDGELFYVSEDIASELDHFRAIREKHGVPVPSDAEQLARLLAEQRVLLAITPDGPPVSWTAWGLD